MSLKISIVVCTRNRCELLRKTLTSLIAQDYPSFDYEVIVVDNYSTDRTKDVVCEFMKNDRGVSVRYIMEEKVGLSYARNRGINESNADIIVFIDDDARAVKFWLSSIQEIYNEKEDAVCVGGKIVLEWSAPKPFWWSSQMDPHHAGLDYGILTKKLSYPSYPYGGNISFKRSILISIGMFDTELGRIGEKPLAGEEIEVCLRIEKQGGGIYYCPNMIIYHLAQPERLTKKFINNRSYWHGRSLALIESRYFGKKRVLKNMPGILRQIMYLLKTGFNNSYAMSMIWYKIGYIQQGWVLMFYPVRKV